MNPFLRTVATALDRLVWTVGCLTIISYASDHWSSAYMIVTVACLFGFGIFGLWMYFIRPFLAGLRGE